MQNEQNASFEAGFQQAKQVIRAFIALVDAGVKTHQELDTFLASAPNSVGEVIWVD